MVKKLLVPCYLFGLCLVMVLGFVFTKDFNLIQFAIFYLVISRFLIIPGMCRVLNGKLKPSYFIPIVQDAGLFNTSLKALIHYIAYTVELLLALSWFMDATTNLAVLVRWASIAGVVIINIIDGILLNGSIEKFYGNTAVVGFARIMLFLPAGRFFTLAFNPERKAVGKSVKETTSKK